MSDEGRTTRGGDISAEEWAARAGSFGAQAAAYAHGRPSYPTAGIRWGLSGVPAGGRVLDLAAGTGKLTETMLRLGYDVVAVEPLAEMRALIPAAATTLDGTAEAIPLEDDSVDAVTVAQAWHWFDVRRACAEVRRVLRPGGRLAIFWNLYDGSDPLTLEFVRATKAMTSENDPVGQHVPWPENAGLGDAEVKAFGHREPYDADRLVAYASSHSWIINADGPTRAAVLASVRALAPAGEFTLAEQTTVWRGRAE